MMLKRSRLFKELKETDNQEYNVNVYFMTENKHYIGHYLSKILLYKGINSKVCSRLIAWGKCDDNMKEIISAVNGICIDYSKKRMSLLLAALWHTFIFTIFYGRNEKFMTYKYKDIIVGDVLCDGIVRVHNRVYTINKIKLRYAKIVLVLFYYIVSGDFEFSENKPDVFLTHELGHQNAIFVRLAMKYGAKVYTCQEDCLVEHGNAENMAEPYVYDLLHYIFKNKINALAPTVDYASWSDNYYTERRKGYMDKDAKNAFANKPIIGRKEWMDIVGADSSKKNIFIMAHCFSDNAYTSSSKSLYKDYYVWTEETLKLASKITNVNWVLKAHPTRFLYNEGNDILNIFNKYKTGNMYVFDDKYNSNSLCEIADAMITISGTCGYEYAVLGKPIIITGMAIYKGYGFTYEPETVEEYERLLRRLDTIQPLNKEQVDAAKKVSYAVFNRDDSQIDELDKIIFDVYGKDINDNAKNDELLKKMEALLDSGYKLMDHHTYISGQEEAEKYFCN